LKGGGTMSEINDQQHHTAERLSNEVNNPSTSAMENNENDLPFKSDKNAFIENEPESATDSNPAWFKNVQNAAFLAKTSFSDQLDYYNAETGEIE
jgi:hypothetical protein